MVRIIRRNLEPRDTELEPPSLAEDTTAILDPLTHEELTEALPPEITALTAAARESRGSHVNLSSSCERKTPCPADSGAERRC